MVKGEIEPDAGNAPMGEPLDPRQVALIGAVHAGFLYQHLYAVACLLSVGRQDGASTIVERDEDSEVVAGDRWTYTQVKVRNRPLQRGDIRSALERFDELRKEHDSKRRPGQPQFQVVSNAELGPGLVAEVADPNWPTDVTLVTPSSPHGDLPPAWPDIDAAFAWCVERANAVPFGALSSETLVWKLAALVLHASTGARDRTFHAANMPALLEQLLVQLQDFPDPPPVYRPQIGEPPMVTAERLRVIMAFSGAGKTAWASQAALHCPDPVAYFDVAELPSASMATSLARELAARFLGGRSQGKGGGIFAESSGLNVLRLTARRLAEENLSVLVVLDNAHRVDPEAIRTLVDAAPTLRFLCLGQPWEGATLLEALFSQPIERLGGWGVDDIAAEFADASAPATIETAQRLQRLTGGLPLYVRNAALVAARDFGGSADAFADTIESRTNDQATAQEVILEAVFARLGPGSARVAAVLSASEVPLSRAEATTLFNAAGLKAEDTARALRELRRAAIVVGFQGDRFGLHDATRILAAGTAPLNESIRSQVLLALVHLLIESAQRERDVGRLGFLMRLLPQVGLVDVLVDLAGDEMFHEQGDPRSLRQELENAAADTAKSTRDRFWANDSIAYWESRDGGQPSRARLDAMDQLVKEGSLGQREQMALIFKELAYWGIEADLPMVDQLFRAGALLPVADDIRRMLRFNFAIALFRAHALKRARLVVDRLIQGDFDRFGITEQDLLGKSNLAIMEMIGDRGDTEDFKRLGDALNLWSTIVVDMGEQPMLRRISALKFYSLGQAARSVVTAGEELVDDFIDIFADPVGALEVMDQHVLPVLREYQLTDMVIPIRSHYAIVLAWNRRHAEARREMAALAEYAASPEQATMLQERSAEIDAIASGRRYLVRRPPPPDAMARILGMAGKTVMKVGRNDACPCGSGVKFKKCCA